MKRIGPLNILCLSAAMLTLSAGSLMAQGNTNTDNTPVIPIILPQQGLVFTTSPVTSVFVNNNYSYSPAASGSNSNSYTFSSTNLPSWLTLTGGGAAGINKINQVDIGTPGATAIDAIGNVYAISNETRFVYKITADGTTTQLFKLYTPSGNSISDYYDAMFIGDYLYVCDVGASSYGVARYNMTISNPTAEQVVGGTAGYANMAVKDGYLYVSNVQKGKVIKVKLSDLSITDFLVELEEIYGIEFDASGNLLMADYQNKRILTATPSGQVTIAKSNLPNYPTDIKMGDETYYVACWGEPIMQYNTEFTLWSELSEEDFYAVNLSLSPSGKLAFPSMFVNPGVYAKSGSAALAGKPSYADIGTHNIKLTVTDGITSKDQEFTITVSDPYAPELVTKTPAHNSTEIPLDTQIKLVFSEKIKAGTGKVSIKRYPSGITDAAIEVTGNHIAIDDEEVTLTLSNDLEPNTWYEVAIDATAFTDIAGNAYVANPIVQQPFPFFAPVNTETTPINNTENSLPTTNNSSSPGWLFQTVEKVKLEQTITFAAKDTVTYGDKGFVPEGSSSSELELTYTSENESIAKVIDNKIYIRAAGDVEIIATQSGNSDYKAAASVTQMLHVKKKDITAKIKADIDLEKVYDGTTSLESGKYTFSLVGIDSEDDLIIEGELAFDNANAGTNKTITATDFILSGEAAENYNLTTTTTSSSQGVITPKEVNIDLNEAAFTSKDYDGDNSAPVDPELYHIYGVLDMDNLTVTANAKYNDKNVGGEKEIVINTFVLNGSGNQNYVVVTSEIRTSGDIKAVPLVITADNKSKKEGEANPALTLSYTGFVAGDNVNSLEELPKTQTTASLKSPIGYYDITATGAESNNYTISYTGGKLTIIPAAGRVKTWSNGSTLTVRIYADVAQKAAITLYTEVGQPIVIQRNQLQPGINTFSFPITPLTMGFYVLNVNADKFNEAQRVKIK